MYDAQVTVGRVVNCDSLSSCLTLALSLAGLTYSRDLRGSGTFGNTLELVRSGWYKHVEDHVARSQELPEGVKASVEDPGWRLQSYNHKESTLPTASEPRRP